VIFPEGGVRLGEDSAVHGSGMFKEGAAALARIAQAPVLPVLLAGTRAPYDWRNWFFRRPVISIHFGEPFHLDKHAPREQATELLRRHMAEMANATSPVTSP
jgi:1-acyl-sn-glycerol-3-phosphate acyltransferase